MGLIWCLFTCFEKKIAPCPSFAIFVKYACWEVYSVRIILKIHSLIVAVTLLTAVASFAASQDVKLGDTFASVKAALGEPRGFIKDSTYQLLQYDRGRVELHDGLVSSVNIVSEEEAERMRIKRERFAEERRLAAALRREQLRIEGLQALEQVRSDPEYDALSAEKQVAFWKSFKKRYPDVPLGEEYASALERHKLELEHQEMEQRIAALESRVREAESRADQAEWETSRDNSRRYTFYSAYTYPVYYPRHRRSNKCVPKSRYTSAAACQPSIKGPANRHTKSSRRSSATYKSPYTTSYTSPYVTHYKSPYVTSYSSPYTTCRSQGSALTSFRLKY
jgi:hypothetical protein